VVKREDEAVQEPVAIPVGAMSVLEDVIHQLEEIVHSARSMPLSTSALVHRQDLLDLIETLKRSLPEEIARARTILRDAEDVIQRGREQAGRLIAEAKAERERLVSKTEVMEVAAREAERLMAQAEAHSKRIRNEAERYVEGKLATFEVVLQKTLAAVERGRARLEGRTQADELAPEELE
jgi:F0F1-type ATP synthase membrane subunit b/b'